MLSEKSFLQTLEKLKRLNKSIQSMLFTTVDTVTPVLFETTEPLHVIPSSDKYAPVTKEKWGGEGVYGWFKCNWTVPNSLNGKTLFLYPKMAFFEGTMWVNGIIHSNYAAKFVEGSHGNHYANRFVKAAKAGDKYTFDLECYAYHRVPGTQPLDYSDLLPTYLYDTGDIDICTRDDELMEFMFDLKTLISLVEAPNVNEFRKSEVKNALYSAHLNLFYDPATCTKDEFMGGIRKTSPILKEQLAKVNSNSAPYVGLIGHSHMDTAWLWPITETEKKCARTYANQMNLMDEYPEYTFVQSSAYHSDVIRRKYPELFERIKKAVAEGKYEPNGGVWVECDCNLTGGEYMIRQFLWGQRFTRKYFNYTSDSFWLPDTFGYSKAIPQIMKGCDVKYFLTTKIAWGDTTRFPYTSFYWQGIDGTKVLTHFNRTHIGPTPEVLHELTDGSDLIKEPRVSDMRLFSYGKGDGGGGPEFEMIESARRLNNLDGVPKSKHTTVSEFMNKLEETIVNPSVYSDELYLELHRGTLTNHHEIKHNNRFAEIAIHDLEVLTVKDAVGKKVKASSDEIAPLLNDLLVRQFHDILPGTCINSVHVEARKVVGEVINKATEKSKALIKTDMCPDKVTVLNTLSFDRCDTVYIKTDKAAVKGYASQAFTDLDGNRVLAVSGVSIPAFGSIVLELTNESDTAASPFIVSGDTLITPFAKVIFDENGFIKSFVDLSNGRELVNGMPLNTFIMCEDLPAAWDNWDIDADIEEKLKPCATLLNREIINNGPVELRIRSTYKLTDKSTIEQDMVFSATNSAVVFDTVMNWQEEHRFLKTAFDTAVFADGVRNEIQFGYIRRSNHRSTDVEKARFETCNHKYTDLSETNYGIAILNDSKYGISVNEGSMRLSLHKGGMLPDEKGDKGRHKTRYAMLPHASAFGAESVVEPAYKFNYLPVVVNGAADIKPLLSINAKNIIAEAVKPCEDAENAYVLRLYECVGDYTNASITFNHDVSAVYECNMLEEEKSEISSDTIAFKPFEIKTIKVKY